MNKAPTCLCACLLKEYAHKHPHLTVGILYPILEITMYSFTSELFIHLQGYGYYDIDEFKIVTIYLN